MAPVRVARAFRLPIIAAMTALALSGCIRRSAPVAVAPQPTLDTIAYVRSGVDLIVQLDRQGGRRGISTIIRTSDL